METKSEKKNGKEIKASRLRRKIGKRLKMKVP